MLIFPIANPTKPNPTGFVNLLSRWYAMVVPGPVSVPLGFRLLMGVLGAVLLAAAVLKAAGSERVAAVAAAEWTARAEVQGALISAEIVLGLWFLSGVGVRAARWAAIAVFAVFAGVSGSAALAGAPSCGCLGPVRVNPWGVLAFDLVAVFFLIVARP